MNVVGWLARVTELESSLPVPLSSTYPVTDAEPTPTSDCNALAEIDSSYPSECPAERQDRNYQAALELLRLKAGAWYWPDGQNSPKSLNGF